MFIEVATYKAAQGYQLRRIPGVASALFRATNFSVCGCSSVQNSQAPKRFMEAFKAFKLQLQEYHTTSWTTW
jgi:hypothetical protein